MEKNIHIDDLIGLWKKWQPTLDFVCPSQVSSYYWFCYDFTHEYLPLFPRGEINDLIAVISGSKPSCYLTPQSFPSEDKNILSKLIEIAQKKKITIISQDNLLVASFSPKVIDPIINAIKSHDRKEMGLLLGYPLKAVDDFMDGIDQACKNIRLATCEDKIIHNIHEQYPDKPTFEIPSKWFDSKEK